MSCFYLNVIILEEPAFSLYVSDKKAYMSIVVLIFLQNILYFGNTLLKAFM